jgi:nucleoid-associated protein EbfC
MFDMMGMMGKMKEVQAKMKEAQEQLQHITVTAEAGAGLVKATVNGQRKLLKIEIDESLLNVNDREMVNDLVVAAVNNAMMTAGERAQEELKKSTEGLLPNIPGLDLGNFGL